jgi:hypothetical protein
MESQLASQLAKMLKDAEDRESSARKVEISYNDRMHLVVEREKALSATAEQVHRDSVALDEYRNVSEERQKTLAMMNKIRKDEELLEEKRHQFAEESQRITSELHKEKVELTGLRQRLKDGEAQLVENIELLKQEKIDHHEQVLRDLADIESKKREVVNADR